MKFGVRAAALVALFATSVIPAASAPPPSELIERVDRAWRRPRMHLAATMTVTQAGHPSVMSRIAIDRDGPDRVRVLFLDPPKDHGKIVLIAGQKTWLYLPRAHKVVEVSRRRIPLAAGVLFDDIAPTAADQEGARVVDEPEALRLVIAAAPGAARGSAELWFDRTTLLPSRREDRSPAGRLLRQVFIEATRAFQGAEIPSRVRVVDLSRGRIEIALVVDDVSPLPADASALFDPGQLGSP